MKKMIFLLPVLICMSCEKQAAGTQTSILENKAKLTTKENMRTYYPLPCWAPDFLRKQGC